MKTSPVFLVALLAACGGGDDRHVVHTQAPCPEGYYYAVVGERTDRSVDPPLVTIYTACARIGCPTCGDPL